MSPRALAARVLAARVLAASLVAALLLWCGPAAAQGFDMAKGGGDTQIQVYADNGIEWVQGANRVIARGNAKAIRGTMTVTADTLTAYYRQGPSGNEIWRIDADGHVTISNPNDTATGDQATYDLDKAIFVLHGQPARLVTPTASFSADDSLEYWELQHMAVLRGHGVAIQKDKTLEADVLTAHFKDKTDTGKTGASKTGAGKTGAGKTGPSRNAAPLPVASAPTPVAAPPAGGRAVPGGGHSGGMDLERADAYGHVALTTAQERVTGDRGDYNMETGIATVSGSVKITRQGNELDGGYAHVDLNTGISKLFGGAPGGGGDQRARGVFVPEHKDAARQQPVFHGSVPQGKAETAPAAGGSGAGGSGAGSP